MSKKFLFSVIAFFIAIDNQVYAQHPFTLNVFSSSQTLHQGEKIKSGISTGKDSLTEEVAGVKKLASTPDLIKLKAKQEALVEDIAEVLYDADSRYGKLWRWYVKGTYHADAQKITQNYKTRAFLADWNHYNLFYEQKDKIGKLQNEWEKVNKEIKSLKDTTSLKSPRLGDGRGGEEIYFSFTPNLKVKVNGKEYLLKIDLSEGNNENIIGESRMLVYDPFTNIKTFGYQILIKEDIFDKSDLKAKLRPSFIEFPKEGGFNPLSSPVKDLLGIVRAPGSIFHQGVMSIMESRKIKTGFGELGKEQVQSITYHYSQGLESSLLTHDFFFALIPSPGFKMKFDGDNWRLTDSAGKYVSGENIGLKSVYARLTSLPSDIVFDFRSSGPLDISHRYKVTEGIISLIATQGSVDIIDTSSLFFVTPGGESNLPKDLPVTKAVVNLGEYGVELLANLTLSEEVKESLSQYITKENSQFQTTDGDLQFVFNILGPDAAPKLNTRGTLFLNKGIKETNPLRIESSLKLDGFEFGGMKVFGTSQDLGAWKFTEKGIGCLGDIFIKFIKKEIKDTGRHQDSLNPFNKKYKLSFH